MLFCFKTVHHQGILLRPSLMEPLSMGVQVAKSSNVNREFCSMWPTQTSTVRWERVDYNNLVLYLVSFLAHSPPEDFYLLKNVGCIYRKKDWVHRSDSKKRCTDFNAHFLNIDPNLENLDDYKPLSKVYANILTQIIYLINAF